MRPKISTINLSETVLFIWVSWNSQGGDWVDDWLGIWQPDFVCFVSKLLWARFCTVWTKLAKRTALVISYKIWASLQHFRFFFSFFSSVCYSDPNLKVNILLILPSFAYWLRSSVVSVLFSLISEIPRQWKHWLYLFLSPAELPLCLHMLFSIVFGVSHCLSATRKTFFIASSGLPVEWRRIGFEEIEIEDLRWGLAFDDEAQRTSKGKQMELTALDKAASGMPK